MPIRWGKRRGHQRDSKKKRVNNLQVKRVANTAKRPINTMSIILSNKNITNNIRESYPWNGEVPRHYFGVGTVFPWKYGISPESPPRGTSQRRQCTQSWDFAGIVNGR